MDMGDCLLMLKMQTLAMRQVELEEVVGAIAQVDQDEQAGLFPGVLFGKKHPLCCLSSVPYKADTALTVSHNSGTSHTFGALEEVSEFLKPETLTRHVNVNGLVALTAYMEACDAYTPSETGGAAFLNFGGLHILGGWAKAYSPVNCTPSQADQQRSVFHITAGKLTKLRARSPAYRQLASDSEALVRQYVVAEDNAKQGAGVYQLACMDILFQHSRSVHFTNHRDTEASAGLIKDLVITLVWLISPNGSSSLRVAGAADAAKMDRPGTGHMFVSDMFHRTDVTTTGTVKVTCFFQRTQVKPAKAPAKAVKAAASKAEAPQEPHETKQKDVPEPTLFHPVRAVEEGAEGEEENEEEEEEETADSPAQDTDADAADERPETEKGEHASTVRTVPGAAQSTNAEGGDEMGRTDEAPASAEEAETA